MIEALKERIISLMIESRAIRVRSWVQANVQQRNRMHARLLEAGKTPEQIKRILGRARVATPVEVNTWIAENEQRRNGLDFYRRVTLRKDARNHLLAYNFLRGQMYCLAEAKAYAYPEWEEIEKIALKFSGAESRVVRQRFTEWKQNAENDFHQNRLSPPPQVYRDHPVSKTIRWQDPIRPAAQYARAADDGVSYEQQ